MKITQDIVDKIVARAKDSDYGLSNGLTYKQGHLDITQYSFDEQSQFDALALCLVNAYDNKYDLISVFKAALEVLNEEGKNK